MGITIKDLASDCSVDISTVSRALRDDSRVKPATRDRIKKRAAELGYSPNLAARSLVAGKTKTIWFILPSLPSSLEREHAQYASQYCDAHGFDLLVALHHGNPETYKRLLRRLSQGVADGAFIIAGSSEKDEGVEPLIKELTKKKFPIVFLDRHIPSIESHTVSTDNVKGSFKLVESCYQAGARHLALLYGEGNTTIEARFEGALKAAKKLKMSYEIFRQSVGVLTKSKLPKKVALVGNDQTIIQDFLRANAKSYENKKIYFGVFDRWHGEPYPGEKAFVCVQDFETVAREGAKQIISMVGKRRLPKPKAVLVDPLRYEVVEPTFGA